MTYQVHQKNKKFVVIEKDTGIEVFRNKKEKDSRNMCRSLNLGSGFAGSTPTFFTLFDEKMVDKTT